MMKAARELALPITIVLVLAFICLMGLLPEAYALASDGEDALTEQEIRARFQEINETYDIGEPFSDEDAAFVLKYGNTADTDEDSKESGSTRGSFSISGSAYGTTVTAYGTLYHNGTFNYTYGANATITKTAGGTPQVMKFTVHCTSYGVIDSDGIGKIYDDEVSFTRTNVVSFSASPSRTYSGIMVTYVVEAWVDVTTSDGNFFTVHA